MSDWLWREEEGEEEEVGVLVPITFKELPA